MSLLILCHVVVTVLAFRTFQSNSCAHNFHLAFNIFTYVLLMVASHQFLGIKKSLLPFAQTLYHGNKRKSSLFLKLQGCFMNYPWADLTYCILPITSLILFLIHWSCKKAQINSISLYRTFFQRYSFYIVNRDWLCLETHTVPAKRHCHKSSPSFLSLYLPDPSRTLPDAGCCMRIF